MSTATIDESNVKPIRQAAEDDVLVRKDVFVNAPPDRAFEAPGGWSGMLASYAAAASSE